MLYAKFIEKELGKRGKVLKNIFRNFTLGSHKFFQIDITDEFMLGKYYIKADIYVDGFKTNPSTEEFDYFLVEELLIETESKKTIIVNKSPETTNFRICHSDNEGNLIELLEKVGGNSKYIISDEINLEHGFIIYAEDQKILPLFKGSFIHRNPKVKSIEQDSTFYIEINNDEYIEISEEIADLWRHLDSFKSKNSILKKFSFESYQFLFEKDLLFESNTNETFQ